MTQTTEKGARTPVRPSTKVARPRLTTMKIRPTVSAALRLEAALLQRSATGIMEEAILGVLKKHGLDPGKTISRDGARPGRPGPTVESVASSLPNLPMGRCVAIATRLSARAAALLEDLSETLGRPMGDIAEEGVLTILSRSDDPDVRALAGHADESAFDSLQRIASDPQAFTRSKRHG